MSENGIEADTAEPRKLGGLRGLRDHLLAPFSNTGLFFAALFFFTSLTPSMIPRPSLAQAGLSGLCLAAGYGLGVFLHWLWTYLQLPVLRETTSVRLRKFIIGFFVVLAVWGLWMGQRWDNVIRSLMEVPSVGAGRIFVIGLVALVIALVLVVLGRAVGMYVRAVMRFVARHLPRRIANVLGVIVAVLLLTGLVNGVIVESVINMLDESYRRADALIPPEMEAPTNPLHTGSPASLVAWNELGRQGRRYIAATPTAADIAVFAGESAMAPLRVYAGLPAADSPEERAKLALEELKRVDGFSRKALVIITPTGSGWVDPSGIDGIEYLYRGDVASVSVQYSYLSSPMTLLMDPETGRTTARALFREVYGYWRTLPEEQRPKLYLHGLSLGAFNSERSFEMFELLDAPIQGAVWSGPPFSTPQWAAATRTRNPGSPIWRPEFRDGSFVRFMNQDGLGDGDYAPWGPMRVVYLQYGSDAVTFFEPSGFLTEPEWLKAPLPPDISPSMRWYPLVTMTQTAMDMSLSMGAPMGFGHVYSPSHYMAAWLQATGIDDWAPEDVKRLGDYLDERRRAELSGN